MAYQYPQQQLYSFAPSMPSGMAPMLRPRTGAGYPQTPQQPASGGIQPAELRKPFGYNPQEAAGLSVAQADRAYSPGLGAVYPQGTGRTVPISGYPQVRARQYVHTSAHCACMLGSAHLWARMGGLLGSLWLLHTSRQCATSPKAYVRTNRKKLAGTHAGACASTEPPPPATPSCETGTTAAAAPAAGKHCRQQPHGGRNRSESTAAGAAARMREFLLARIATAKEALELMYIRTRATIFHEPLFSACVGPEGLPSVCACVFYLSVFIRISEAVKDRGHRRRRLLAQRRACCPGCPEAWPGCLPPALLPPLPTPLAPSSLPWGGA